MRSGRGVEKMVEERYEVFFGLKKKGHCDLGRLPLFLQRFRIFLTWFWKYWCASTMCCLVSGGREDESGWYESRFALVKVRLRWRESPDGPTSSFFMSAKWRALPGAGAHWAC